MKKYLFLLIISVLFFEVSFSQKYFQTRWQNRPRNVIVYLPKNFSASENLPLVINMHGFTTTAQFQFEYTQFHKTADSVRCIVIYPEGVDLRWNSGTFFGVTSTVDDVGFLSDWMDRVAVLYNADMKKIFSMGYSAGGFMSYKLGCDLTNRLAAIGPDVASMVSDNLNSCVPARPLHIAAFNGLSDPITSYGGIPGNFPSIDSVKHFWQIKNNCDVLPIIDTLPDLKNDGTRVVRYTYQNCSQNVQQVYYKVINGGHVWPGSNDQFGGILGKTTQDISMNNEAWNFFKSKEVPIAVRCDAPFNLQSMAVSADSFLLSFSPSSGASVCKIALIDDSDHVTFYETTNTSIGVKIDPNKLMRWNVASLCNSGFHNWNTTRALNFSPTGIKINATEKISIYPNPCNDFIQVDLTKIQHEKITIAVFNLIGEVVFTSDRLPSDGRIETKGLSKGWYQLRIDYGGKQFVSSFIKD